MDRYSRIVGEHFHNPRNVGKLVDADAEGFAGYQRAGPFMRFTAIEKEGAILQILYQTYGCAPAIAVGSLLSEQVKGRPVSEARGWTVERLLEALGGLPSDKEHCARLGIEALHQ